MADARSNTMELTSILEEARRRKSSAGSNTGSQRTGTTTRSTSAAKTTQRKPQSAAARQKQASRSINDDFIFTDDSYTRRDSKPKAKQTTAKKAKKNGKKGKKTALIVTLSIVGVLLIAAVAGLTLYLNSGSKDTFADNVYVSGKSMKDLTVDQARSVLASVENELANGIKVDIKAGDKTYSYGKDDFKYSFNTDEVLAEAKAYSEERGFKNNDQNYEIKMTVSDETCADIVKNLASEVKVKAVDAEVTSFDPSADDMFTITESTVGRELNETDTLNAFSGFIKEGKISGTVDAVVTETQPKYSKEYLAANIVELSHFSTVSTNNANGNENMRVSLAACNGSVIDPGETWSFNECTGNSNLESNGYKPAGVLIQGRSETGIGGGICQSSTTIYNAGILCGMEVEERQPHYYKSTYADAGRDATVDYGNIDLKMSNPFDYQLFMKCWMDGTELNCTIYGIQTDEFDDIEISTTSPTYVSNGYRVYTSRTFYKNGEEVRTEDLPSSTYYTSAPSSGSSGSSGSSSSSGSSGSDDSDSSGSSDDTGSDSGSSSSDDGSSDSGSADTGSSDTGAGDAGADVPVVEAGGSADSGE